MQAYFIVEKCKILSFFLYIALYGFCVLEYVAMDKISVHVHHKTLQNGIFYIEIYVYLWGPYTDQDMSAHQFYDFF